MLNISNLSSRRRSTDEKYWNRKGSDSGQTDRKAFAVCGGGPATFNVLVCRCVLICAPTCLSSRCLGPRSLHIDRFAYSWPQFVLKNSREPWVNYEGQRKRGKKYYRTDQATLARHVIVYRRQATAANRKTRKTAATTRPRRKNFRTKKLLIPHERREKGYVNILTCIFLRYWRDHYGTYNQLECYFRYL